MNRSSGVRRPADLTLALPVALSLSLALALTLVLSGCSDDEPTAEGDQERIVLTPAEGEGGHTHAPGQEHAGTPLGNGTTATAGGYTIDEVTLPEADGPGEVSFQIVDKDGQPLTSYVEEQTKLLHLYVVRSDLGAFRHLHPALDDTGTWRTQVDLGAAGAWRVIAEFKPDGGASPIIIGRELTVPGKAPAPATIPTGEAGLLADDGVVQVRVLDGGMVSENGRLQLVVSDLEGRPLTLGSYLGAAAHLTGFARGSDLVVHVHPYGSAEVTDDGTQLTFHTTFTEPGDYRMFLQVRVDGLLHQVAVTVPVAG